MTHKEADGSSELVSFPYGTGLKATTPQKDDGPIIPDGRLYEAYKKFRTKQETDDMRRPTGSTWFGLISTNICARKYLASHN